MREHYARGLEAGRLDNPKGIVEFERTMEIVLRSLPAPPALVADVGGGPGRYAFRLAERGYKVELRDITDLHIDQARAVGAPLVHSAVGDARELDLGDSSVDAVLLLGPLYHLPDRADRVRALCEARRVVRPGGPIFAAVISRWSARLDGIMTEQLYESRPDAVSLLEDIEATGQLPPFAEGSFSGYVHRPDEPADEIRDSALELDDLVGVEGIPLAATDLSVRLENDAARAVLFDAARAIERIPELLGLSSHLIATARRPTSA